MTDDARTLPASLDRFGIDLVSRLHLLQRRARQRRIVAVAIAAMALLAGSAIAATHALDNPPRGYRISHDTFVIDPAEALYGQFERDLRRDTLGAPLEITLPPSTRGLAGTQAHIRHLQGAYCVQLASKTTCGAPSDRLPIVAVGFALPKGPYVATGVEASNVVRHTIRCGHTRQDVTSNAGPHLFLYVTERLGPRVRCMQISTLRGGRTVTTALP